jgi:lipoprotein-releasing system permease protein
LAEIKPYFYAVSLSYDIAKRMLRTSGEAHRYSRPVLRISVWSIALGMAVMILAVAIITGFQRDIRDIVIGFGSHIQITVFNENPSLETDPVVISQDFYPALRDEPGVKNIQVYAHKPAVLQSSRIAEDGTTAREIQGVVVKGVSGDYDWTFMQSRLTEGVVPTFSRDTISNQLLISKTLAAQLQLKTGDTVAAYFLNNSSPRERKFVVCGIYHTGMGEFDKKMVFTDIKHIRILNNWGIEAMLYVRNDVKDGKIIVEAAGKGGDAYLYDFGYGFSDRSTLYIRPGNDTIIQVVVTAKIKPSPLEYGEVVPDKNFAQNGYWIPDTAWLYLRYYPKVIPGIEYELQNNPEIESSGDTHYVYHHPGLNVIAHLRNSGGSRNYYAGGFEVLLESWDDLQNGERIVNKWLGPEFRAKTIQKQNKNLFHWLSYLNINVWVILSLMLIVSLINMSSTLLVLILERTNMIGIIKSMGGTNKLLRNTFVWNGIFLIGKGLLIGNVLGIGLALLQQYTGAIGLDQNTYFIDRVPIYLDALHLLLLNAGTLLICFVTLLLPAWFVARITPVKAIRFQ